MSDLDIARLRELASEATPGPWLIGDGTNETLHQDKNALVWMRDGQPCVFLQMNHNFDHTADAAYIAAANPATLLAILDRLEAAEKKGEIGTRMRARLEKERDAARAEVERLRGMFEGTLRPGDPIPEEWTPAVLRCEVKRSGGLVLVYIKGSVSKSYNVDALRAALLAPPEPCGGDEPQPADDGEPATPRPSGHVADSGTPGVCQGECEEHLGKVVRVHVAAPGGIDWGEFWYCQAAINEDREGGLVVTPVGEPAAPHPTCETCRWWGPLAEWNECGNGNRLCCRFPGRFRRSANDWCGEHAPKEADRGSK